MSAENPLPTRQTTDWEICCLCQGESRKYLRCPFNKDCHHKAYDALETDLKNFVANGVSLPLGVNLKNLDDGSGIANTLLKNKAKYHNGCRSLFRCYMIERELNKRKQPSNEENIVSPKKTRSSFRVTLDSENPQCVCCEKFEVDEDEPMFLARSANCAQNILKWAAESQNWVVHARLNSAINSEVSEAADIYYHHTCYTQLKNAARAASSQPSNTTNTYSSQHAYDPFAFSELVAFVTFSQSPHKLSALRKLYNDRIQTLCSEWIDVNVHTTRFKTHLLKKLGPDWSAFQEGKEVYISHKKTVGTALAEAARLQVTEEEAEKIVDVGLMLRKYILLQQMPFDGSFSSQCLSEPVAQPLLTLIDVLLEGSSSIAQVKDDQASNSSKIRVACTISQLVCSNATKRSSTTPTLYQMRERETPFPLYVGLKLHVNDRQKGNISTFHALGMSVSYDRVMDVRKSLAKAVSKRWAEDGVVVPTNIQGKVFVTSAVDNLDQSGRCEFHGTAMTLTSHPTHDNIGEDPPPLSLDLLEGAPIQLPNEYANVPYVDEYAGDIKLPSMDKELARPTFDECIQTGTPEEAWLDHLNTVSVHKDGELQEQPVTYSGFFSYLQGAEDIRPRAKVGIFPIFYEKASSMAMQKHAMLVSKRATDFINPGQVPVIVGDCPLYIQQKKCQWKYPDEVGESKMVCLMGFLHIEMVSQECGGKLLAGSGWERMFSLAKVVTPGVAVSLLGGRHVKRTRYSYQLTLAWLHILKAQAYDEYCKESYGPHESMAMWERRLSERSPTICYWRTVQDYLLIICRFVRGQRVGDWPLTLSACTDICPWFFAFGHTNYARWMPVFLKDMASLPESHPNVHEAFLEGKFVVQRSDKKFSLMALDQSQEHTIKFLKEDSGTKGLYGQQEEKEIFELSKPEVLRVLEEFENASLSASNQIVNLEHPEASAAEQEKFLGHLKALLNLVTEGTVVNPFKETGPELVTLDTGEVMDPEIASSLKTAPKVGKEMFSVFVRERLETACRPLSDVIPRTTLYTFRNRPQVDLKKGTSKLGSAKANAALITKLFLSLQARPDADIDDFFRHENLREPPALSDRGKMLTGMKSSLLNCLPGMPDPGVSPAAKEASVVVCDMAAVIHMVKPHRAKVFGDYTQMHLLPFLECLMTNNTTRLDAVWDTYQEESLKSQTRARRGETRGQRTRVLAKIPIPRGAEWQKFLKESENKDALFQFLSDQLVQETTDASYHLLTTKAELVLSNQPSNVTALSPCNHEEADTRMMLHLHHAAEQGHTKAYLRTVDTDVVVLAIYQFHELGLTELWVGFGCGKTFKEIPIHHICQQLGPPRCQALLFFHAFTGCDVTSAMFGIGKKTAWKAWTNFPEATETFIAITQEPESLQLDSLHMRRLERLTVLMYSKMCSANSVNEARKLMFTHGLKALECIPPTQNALLQHIKRALLVAAFIWKHSLDRCPNIPNANEWGWEWNGRTKEWVPYWTCLPDASRGCTLLLHCGCSVACHGNCKCHRAGIRCGTLCKCEGGCTNNDIAT